MPVHSRSRVGTSPAWLRLLRAAARQVTLPVDRSETPIIISFRFVAVLVR
jgi:hypothetical protein